MTVFKDLESAERAKERLEAFTGRTLDRLFEGSFGLAPDPDQALTNLERWLRAVSNPGPYVDQLSAAHGLTKHLMAVLGSSQPLADALVQNPELGAILFDPQELGRMPLAKEIEKEGNVLLGTVSSFTHALDRLRYLKQRWTLPIVLNDLAGNWDEATVWLALSELADALIRLSLKAVWQQSPLVDALGSKCPFLIVGFGKLGGRELNYSSDIDLVYAAPDDLPESASRDAQRFCEALSRALSDSMGRGFLYRVDLRLRPYGGSGPILPTMRAVENYYQLYAEAWEVQALLRSRAIYGPEILSSRWETLRQERCFGAKLTEASLDTLTSMRTRIEERASDDDLKRGAGGIRDVEFLVQILQLAHGRDHPALQVAATIPAIHALEEANLLDHAVATSLIQGYVFLRQLEHRCQLVADQQTHSLPTLEEARIRLAKLMGEASLAVLSRHLDLHRRTISTLYQSIVHPSPQADTHRTRIGEQLGTLAPAAFQWFDALPDADAFYEVLESNEGSLGRVQKILEGAPALINSFRRSVPLTEMLLSGELEEDFCASDRVNDLQVEVPLTTVAETYSNLQARLAAQWHLEPKFDLSLKLSDLMDALVRHCMKRLYAGFDLVALGSYGRQDLGLHSDADVVLLVPHPDAHPEAEQQAQGLLSMFHSIKRHGAPVEMDLRLRPEGRHGLLVRTYDGLKAYELNRMETWERFALGAARLVGGSVEAREVLTRAAYAQPLTPERLKELIIMKKRIETERVQPQYARRNVKLGHGSIGDIEWFVHLHEMRYPNATKAGANLRLSEGIRSLGRAQLINAVETEQLLAALAHLSTVRFRLALLGYKEDLIPENPDKLSRLALVSGDKDGNAFLERHEHMIDTVRAIYLDGMERLRA